MCGCGTMTWCEGGCVCGCDHGTPEGMERQGKFFAVQAEWKDELWREARAARARVEALCERWSDADTLPAMVTFAGAANALRAALRGDT